MNKKGSSNMWLIAIVAVVAIVGLIVLYLSLSKAPVQAAVTGEAFVLPSKIVKASCTDYDGDGYTSASCGGSDCNDANANVNPGALEICNGIDDDCDGYTDFQYMIPAYNRYCDGSCIDTDNGISLKTPGYAYVSGSTGYYDTYLSGTDTIIREAVCVPSPTGGMESYAYRECPTGTSAIKGTAPNGHSAYYCSRQLRAPAGALG